MIQCKQIMTTDPACCAPSCTVDEVAQMMKQHDIGPVPVVSHDSHHMLVGIITDRDLALKVVATNQQPSKIAASQIMTKEPVCCKPDDDIEDVLDLMQTHQLRRIPVVDEENKLIGIISQADVANRLNWSDKTAQVVEQVSKPISKENANE